MSIFVFRRARTLLNISTVNINKADHLLMKNTVNSFPVSHDVLKLA